MLQSRILIILISLIIGLLHQVTITVLWLQKTSLQTIIKLFGIGTNTIQRWRKHCSKVAVNLAFEDPEQIGGPGAIVEIDESKYGKRKLFPIFFLTLPSNLIKILICV